MEENKNAYSEVIEILKLVDDEEMLEKLPMEMLELLKAKSNPEYKPQILKDIPLEEQNLQKETYSIIAWITTKYWAQEIEESNVDTKENAINEDVSIEHKETVSIKENEVLEEEEEVDTNITEQPVESNLPILYKDMKWYEKIKRKIIEFLNKIFRLKHDEKQIKHI